MEYVTTLALLVVVAMTTQLRNFYFIRSTRPTNLPRVRLPQIDFVKGIAIFSVIVIHAIYLFIEFNKPQDLLLLNTARNLLRYSVGIFIISSGALGSSGLDMQKIKRIFIPYVLVCILIGLAKQLDAQVVVLGIVRGDMLLPFYFIPVLFQLYVIFPIAKKLSNKRYFLLGSFLFSLIFYLNPRATELFGIPTFGPYFYLFALGIAKNGFFIGKDKLGTMPLSVVVCVFAVSAFMLTGYYSNYTYFYSPAVFVLLVSAWKHSFVGRNFFVQLGKVSLWVYLIHFLIEEWLYFSFKFNALTPAAFNILTTSGATLVLSFVAAMVSSKMWNRLLTPTSN